MFGFFDYEKLNFLAKNADYYSAVPFPHVVIDGACSEQLKNVLDGFPKENFFKYDNIFERKAAQNDITRLSYPVKALLAELNSSPFVSFLELLTGVDGLIPDPGYRGAGCHEIHYGGVLKTHVDFNYHPKLRVMRKVNVLLYLNKNWAPSWNGQLELCLPDGEVVQSIDPRYNRMIIFNSDDKSYHGHSKPLKTPDGVTRKSIVAYYYQASVPVLDIHSTRYLVDESANEETKAFAKEREKFREFKK